MKRLNDLFLRSSTGLLFCSVVVGSFFWQPPLFSLLMALAGIIMVYEWYRLSTTKRVLMATPVYPIAPTLFIIFLNQNGDSRHLLIYLFSIIWAFDTGSYIFGCVIGRTKIAPMISPGKTWEGVAGGLVFALLVFYAVYFIRCYTLATLPHIDPFAHSVLVIGICALGLSGDLFESAMKRSAHVKDSGSLLPGHGGLLDRFDAILFPVILFYPLRDILVKMLI